MLISRYKHRHLIIHQLPTLISRYKRQHLPTLTAGYNIPHICGGGLAQLLVGNKHSNHLAMGNNYNYKYILFIYEFQSGAKLKCDFLKWQYIAQAPFPMHGHIYMQAASAVASSY